VLPEVGVPACYPVMPISMGDVPYVVDWAKTLNTAVEKAAAETGTRFVDMWPSSAGHDACEPLGRRWIEPLNGPVNAAPVHPNTAGEAGMAAQVLAQLGR
jgi:GDSL-like Lipase/Acylhydrolase family